MGQPDPGHGLEILVFIRLSPEPAQGIFNDHTIADDGFQHHILTAPSGVDSMAQKCST